MKLKSNQLEMQYTCALWYDLFHFIAKLVFRPQFHGTLNVEKDFRLEILVKVVFNEVEVQSTLNLVYMFPVI